MNIHRTRLTGLCLALIALTWPYAVAQEDGEWIIRGPFGRPVAVMDEGDHWSTPILIYSDDEQEVFVPEITDPGWVSWFAATFRQNGIYSVFLYSYFPNDHWCLKYMTPTPSATKSDFAKSCAAVHYRRTQVEVDTRKKTVTIGQDVLLPTTMFYPSKSTGFSGKVASFAQIKGTPLGKKIDRVTAIIETVTKP
jgi:hypothetical protein